MCKYRNNYTTPKCSPGKNCRKNITFQNLKNKRNNGYIISNLKTFKSKQNFALEKLPIYIQAHVLDIVKKKKTRKAKSYKISSLIIITAHTHYTLETRDSSRYHSPRTVVAAPAYRKDASPHRSRSSPPAISRLEQIKFCNRPRAAFTVRLAEIYIYIYV